MRKAPKLEAAKTEVKRLWVLMCSAEGVSQHEKFVVFSKENPFAAEYNTAMVTFQRLRKARLDRAARREAIASLGMKEVRGALGGRYIE